VADADGVGGHFEDLVDADHEQDHHGDGNHELDEGEGWSVGGEAKGYGTRPHPNPLPEGEGIRASAGQRLLEIRLHHLSRMKVL
jgi:hypothetical protein